MDKKFFGASEEAFDDPYAECNQNSTENRINISKKTIGNQKTSENFPNTVKNIQGTSV